MTDYRAVQLGVMALPQLIGGVPRVWNATVRPGNAPRWDHTGERSTLTAEAWLPGVPRGGYVPCVELYSDGDVENSTCLIWLGPGIGYVLREVRCVPASK